MGALVNVTFDRNSGWVKLTFPWDVSTIAILKEVPGSRWDAGKKCWFVPEHGWEILKDRMQWRSTNPLQISSTPNVSLAFHGVLKPYQAQGAGFAAGSHGALLTMDPRTGKTLTATAAMCTLFEAGRVFRMVITYPSAVGSEWKRQLKQWAGIDIVEVQGYTPFTPAEIQQLKTTPYLVLGCSYELLHERGTDVFNVMQGLKYGVIADELQQAKNRKAERTLQLHSLSASPSCSWRLGTTATPMRNRPRDLWAVFEFIQPGSMGGYWTYAKKYCAAVEGQYGWEDKGESNLDELAKRLAYISFRRTRAEVAKWLPKTDRRVIQCEVKDKKLLAKYTAMEKELATKAMAAIGDSVSQTDRDALEQLAALTAQAKLPVVIERMKYNAIELGVKVLVGAYFHETLKSIVAAAESNLDADRIFVAGGWKTDAQRKKAIEDWRKSPAGSVLFANFLSCGLGIDLSDADVSINAELAWVPTDARQWEDRVVDVHQGKRTTPPRQEYFLTKGTIDEAMAAVVLRKVRSVEAVTGADVEARGLDTALREANLVGSSKLVLPSTDAETVKAAITSARDRWLSSDGVVVTENDQLVSQFGDWDDGDETPESERVREE